MLVLQKRSQHSPSDPLVPPETDDFHPVRSLTLAHLSHPKNRPLNYGGSLLSGKCLILTAQHLNSPSLQILEGHVLPCHLLVLLDPAEI